MDYSCNEVIHTYAHIRNIQFFLPAVAIFGSHFEKEPIQISGFQLPTHNHNEELGKVVKIST
jgi:hypothetical protein